MKKEKKRKEKKVSEGRNLDMEMKQRGVRLPQARPDTK